MSSTNLRFPRLHTEDPSRPAPDTDEGLVESLCSAFEKATGWRLGRVAAGSQASDRRKSPASASADVRPLKIQPPTEGPGASAAKNTLPLDAAEALASCLASLVEQWESRMAAIQAREAELAACVPVASRPDEAQELARRLEAVLRGGASAVGCHAAALYLLDASTTHLKLRASFGLPPSRLLDPPRPLQGAIAELEALLGHAVVLEDAQLLPHWRAPEKFPSAACVPVSTPTTPLGVLWVFSEHKRDFSALQTNLLEIVAGRLAADLERDVLLQAGQQARIRTSAWERAVRWQELRQPQIAPQTPGFEVAGWSSAAVDVNGDFHDWTVLPDGRLALLVGDAHGTTLEAALTAAAAHGACRAHLSHATMAAELLSLANETLWASSAGGQSASLACAILDPALESVDLALCGETMAAICRSDGTRTILSSSEPLGANLEFHPQAASFNIQAGDTLALLSGGARRLWDLSRHTQGKKSLLAPLGGSPDAPLKRALGALEQAFEEIAQEAAPDDRTVVVLRRKTRKPRSTDA